MNFVVRFALTHPATWVYGLAYISMAGMLAVYASVGLLIGTPFGHATAFAQILMAIYFFQIAYNVEWVKSYLDVQVQSLRNIDQLR